MSWNVGNSIVGVVGAISNHNIWAHVQILHCNAFHKRCSSLDLLVHSEVLMQNTSSDCTERSVTFGIERSGDQGKQIVVIPVAILITTTSTSRSIGKQPEKKPIFLQPT